MASSVRFTNHEVTHRVGLRRPLLLKQLRRAELNDAIACQWDDALRQRRHTTDARMRSKPWA